MDNITPNPFDGFIVKSASAFEPGKVYMLNISADRKDIKPEQVQEFAISLKQAFKAHNIDVIFNVSFFGDLKLEPIEVKENEQRKS